MSDPEKRVIRIRVTSGEVAYHGAVIMTPEGKQVKEHHALAGESGEIRSYEPNDPIKQFINMKESLLFNEKADKSRTQDFDRLLARITRNIDFVDKFRLLLKEGLKDKQAEKIRYDIIMEIQGSLGIKEPDILILTQPMSAAMEEEPEPDASADPDAESAGADADATASGPDLSNHIGLTFIISPSTGTPLGQLEIGTEVIARFVDPEEEQTSIYMIEQGLKFAPLPEQAGEDENAPLLTEGLLPDDSAPAPKNEIQATVQSIEVQPDEQTLVYIKLPGDRDGYILEEEKSIKVKTVNEGEAAQKKQEAEAQNKSEAADQSKAGGPAQATSGFPILAVAGAAALFLILLAFFLS